MFHLYCRHPQRHLRVGTVRKCCCQNVFAAVEFCVYAFTSGSRLRFCLRASGSALSYLCCVVSFLDVFQVRSPRAVFLQAVVPGGDECPGFARISARAEQFCSWWAANLGCEVLIWWRPAWLCHTMLSLPDSEPAPQHRGQVDLPSRKHQFWSSAGYCFFSYRSLGLHMGS